MAEVGGPWPAMESSPERKGKGGGGQGGAAGGHGVGERAPWGGAARSSSAPAAPFSFSAQ
jgi:hypothetical protein